MFRAWTTQPIKLSRIQFRLALELAAQEAARAELKRQLSEQIGAPADAIDVDGGTVDFRLDTFPEINIGSTAVEWID
jgi:hypothetical protein